MQQQKNIQKKIKLGNLYAYRDLNYIDDTISAYLKLISTNKKIQGEHFNVGSGYSILIKDLVLLIKEIMVNLNDEDKKKKESKITKKEEKL